MLTHETNKTDYSSACNCAHLSILNLAFSITLANIWLTSLMENGTLGIHLTLIVTAIYQLQL